MPNRTFVLLLISVLLAAVITVALAFGLGVGRSGVGALAVLGVVALLARLVIFAKG